MDPTLTAAQLDEARDWLKDCPFRDLDPEQIGDLDPADVQAAVARHYHGGIAAFIRDAA